MRLTLLAAILSLTAIGCRSISLPVVYAQSLPATLSVTWDANPSAENVTQYGVKLDAGTEQIVLPSACVNSRCTTTFSVAAVGAHALAVRAFNLLVSTDPASLNPSPATTVNFTLSLVGAPGNVKVTK